MGKSRPDRKIVEYGSGKQKVHATSTPEGRNAEARPKRILAFVFWALAIAAEIIAIYFFNNYVVLWPCLVALVADLIFCIIAALNWKKANDIDPPKGRFLKNQFGVIMCLIAFLPLGYVLLKQSKQMPANVKKIISIVAAVCFIAAMGASIDYNPTTVDDLNETKLEQAGYTGVCYWGRYSKSFHFDPDCRTLLNSEVIYEGSIEEAFEDNRKDPCDFCAEGASPKSEAFLNSIFGEDGE